MQEVTGSSPVSPTTTWTRRSGQPASRRGHERAGTRLKARRPPTATHHPWATGEPVRDPPV